jgi:spermidine/putrescine-binding protein
MTCTVFVDSAVAQSRELIIGSPGGTTSRATRTSLAGPFEKDTGVKITLVEAGGPFAAKVTVQRDAGKILWDMVESVGEDDYAEMLANGLLEPLPKSLTDRIRSQLIDGAVREYGVMLADVGVVIVCRAGVKCPGNPREFWDVKNFPGPRAIVGVAAEVLPFAVQAGGVPHDKVYPIDLDLAFRKLEEIKPNVTVWPTSGDQMQQLLRSKEVDMQIMWSGRAFDLKNKGVPVQISWDGGVRELSYLVVLKGAANKDAAFKFIEHYATHPEQQARRVEVIAYTGAHKDLMKYLPEDIKPFLTTSYVDKMVVENGEWGIKNKEEVKRRWSTFLAK